MSIKNKILLIIRSVYLGGYTDGGNKDDVSMESVDNAYEAILAEFEKMIDEFKVKSPHKSRYLDCHCTECCLINVRNSTVEQIKSKLREL